MPVSDNWEFVASVYAILRLRSAMPIPVRPDSIMPMVDGSGVEPPPGTRVPDTLKIAL